MTTIATCDIGGTHARFALAQVSGGTVAELAEPVTLKTNDHASFELAWEEVGRRPAAERARAVVRARGGCGRGRGARPPPGCRAIWRWRSPGPLAAKS